MRTYPADGVLAATPGELAYVDFYDEDFPWRYTPARAKDSKLRPWIALLVLTAEEFTVSDRPYELPVLTPGPRAVLPPVTETWAWAHAQLSRIVAAVSAVDGEIASNPDNALSRLMCPRRLDSDTAYHAFLVPAFEAGRLAGLGRDPSHTPVQRPAWGTPAHASDGGLPIYFRFSFTTSDEGDFETLACKIKPAKAGERFGKRRLDVSGPGLGMTERPGAEVDFEGALAPPEFDAMRVPYAQLDPAVTSEIEGLVDASENRRIAQNVPDDPLVVPPLYGRWHRGVPRVVDAPATPSGQPPDWLVELNVDLRNRVAAGLGVEILRQRKEEYMQRAWEQVGAVEAANQRLREAELARGAADTLMRKHIAQAGAPDRVLVLTAATHAGLPLTTGMTESIRGAIDASALPAAAQSPAFRRITRPQRPMMRRLTDSWDAVKFQDTLLTKMNAPPDSALSAAPPAPDPAAGVDLQTVRSAVRVAVSQFQTKQDRPDRVFMSMTQDAISALLQLTPPLNLDDPAAKGKLQAALNDALTAAYPASSPADQIAVRDRVAALVTAIDGVRGDPPDRALVTLDQPAFEKEFGKEIAGRMLGGLTVKGHPPPDVTDVVPLAGSGDPQAFANALGTFQAVSSITDPAPPAPLRAFGTLPGHVLSALAPAVTIGDRIASALPVIAGRRPPTPRGWRR